MQVPPEIIVKGVRMTPYIERLITKGIAKLEEVCDYIISVRIALEKEQGRRRTGNPYRMRIEMRIPNRPEIVVNRTSKAATGVPGAIAQFEADAAFTGQDEPATDVPTGRAALPRRGIREEPLTAFICRTFDTAQRELDSVVERQRGDIKTHHELSAVVERLIRPDGYGFLRTRDGQQVYFHQNSVLHGHWQDLAVGTVVRYTPQMGEEGPQASSVEPIEKHGAAEVHDSLHELPKVASLHRRGNGASP